MRVQDGPWKICEGVGGRFFYHLCWIESDWSKAFCGAKTMRSGLPLSYWGTRTAIREKYCAECEKVALAYGEDKT